VSKRDEIPLPKLPLSLDGRGEGEGEREMKEFIKGKIVSPDELAKLVTTDLGGKGITYDDIKKIFSNNDLAEYHRLCMCFVRLVGNKSKKEEWDMLFHPITGLEFMSVLNQIQEIREKYKLPGVFHRMWSAKPSNNGNFEYDEISW
jgi:hypothetical protein